MQQKLKIIAALIIGIILGVIGTTLASGQRITIAIERVEQKVAGEKTKSIRIGAILPLSGNAAVWGERSQKGIDLAVEEINKSGGIEERQLKVVYEDTLSEGKTAVNALQKLIAVDKIRVVIGSVNSSETLAMAPMAEESKVILVAPGSASPKVTTAGDYIFRTRVSADIEAYEIAKSLFELLKIKTVALLYRNDDYGVGVAESVEKHFKNFGGTVVQKDGFPPGETDYKTPLVRIKRKLPEVLVIAAEPKEVGLIARQIAELGFTMQILMHSAGKGPELYDIAQSASNGILVLNTFDITREESKEYSEKFKEKYDEEAELFSALAYDTVNILRTIMERCGEINTECIKKELYAIKDYAGVSNILTFDENGDVTQPFILEILREGKFVKYDPL